MKAYYIPNMLSFKHVLMYINTAIISSFFNFVFTTNENIENIRFVIIVVSLT